MLFASCRLRPGKRDLREINNGNKRINLINFVLANPNVCFETKVFSLRLYKTANSFCFLVSKAKKLFQNKHFDLRFDWQNNQFHFWKSKKYPKSALNKKKFFDFLELSKRASMQSAECGKVSN